MIFPRDLRLRIDIRRLIQRIATELVGRLLADTFAINVIVRKIAESH